MSINKWLFTDLTKLVDTDLFLCFIVDYFFNDFALASLLFTWHDVVNSKSSVDLEGYVNAIEYYVSGERLDQLVAAVTEYVDEYERYAVQRPVGYTSEVHDGPNRPSYQNFSGETWDEIQMALTVGSLRSMHMMWPNFSEGRHILRLFVAPAEFEIDEHGHFRAICVNTPSHIEGSALDVARPHSKDKISGQGSVEAILLTTSIRVVMCVFLGHELVATIDILSGQVNETDSAAACDRLAPYLALEAASVEIQKERYFRDDSRAAELASALRARAKHNSDEFFSNLGLGKDNRHRQDVEVLKTLDKGGIVQLLEHCPGYAEWLARLSLSAAGGLVTFEEAASHWRIDKNDIEVWLTKLNRTLSELCGKEAFAISDDVFGLGQF